MTAETREVQAEAVAAWQAFSVIRAELPTDVTLAVGCLSVGLVCDSLPWLVRLLKNPFLGEG